MGWKICDGHSRIKGEPVKFSSLSIQGAYLIDFETREDDRGFFARTFCKQEFADIGIDFNPVQNSKSHNRSKGTLRGMHFQKKPNEEAKIVTCTKGAIYDVIVDYRKDSTTWAKWESISLHEHSNNALYIPEGLAHGFITLLDNTEVYYQMNEYYSPDASGRFHWNSPSLGIEWPNPPELISPADQQARDFASIFETY